MNMGKKVVLKETKNSQNWILPSRSFMKKPVSLGNQ